MKTLLVEVFKGKKLKEKGKLYREERLKDFLFDTV